MHHLGDGCVRGRRDQIPPSGQAPRAQRPARRRCRRRTRSAGPRVSRGPPRPSDQGARGERRGRHGRPRCRAHAPHSRSVRSAEEVHTLREVACTRERAADPFARVMSHRLGRAGVLQQINHRVGEPLEAQKGSTRCLRRRSDPGHRPWRRPRGPAFPYRYWSSASWLTTRSSFPQGAAVPACRVASRAKARSSARERSIPPRSMSRSASHARRHSARRRPFPRS